MDNKMLWICLDEAEQRKLNSELPIDVRIRAAQTFAELLREAHNRGYDYGTLKAEALS